MSVNNFDQLSQHVGHDIVCSAYGGINVVLECETCFEILLDYDKDES